MFKANKKSNPVPKRMRMVQRGFTLIELLIVIGIISILAGIVLVAVNPAVQFGKANDSERKSEIGAILSSIYQYQTSPTVKGSLPQCTKVGTGIQLIPECDTNGMGIGVLPDGGFEGAIQLGTANGNYDCRTALIPHYLREIPIDPKITVTDGSETGYYICHQADFNGVDRIYVIAPLGEVYTSDGGCEIPGTTTPAMCVSG